MQGQCAAHGVRQFPGDSEAQAAAAARLPILALLERLEQACSLPGIDADAAVDHIDQQFLRIDSGPQLYAQINPADIGELHRVGQQVVDNLPQAFGIEDDRGCSLWDGFEAQLQPLQQRLWADGVQRLPAEQKHIAGLCERYESALGQTREFQRAIQHAAQRMASRLGGGK